MTKEIMIAALNTAFAEHMVKLFSVLATSESIATAAPRFAKGLSNACDAYDEALAAIDAEAP